MAEPEGAVTGTNQTSASVPGRVIRGRYVAEPPPGTVVFLFGLTINRWSAVHRWLPVWWSFRRMRREQRQRPASGMLWSTSWREGSTFMVRQYWRDLPTLMEYAQSRSFRHAPAWKRYNHGVGDTGEIGLWHEAYAIDPERMHTIYRDVPRIGLAAATVRTDAQDFALRKLAERRHHVDGTAR